MSTAHGAVEVLEDQMTISRSLALMFVLGMTACSSGKSDEPPAKADSALTYYDDVAPILQDHCLQCHQQGGIAPFRLDDFATAKTNSAAMVADTAARIAWRGTA
jgi:mono/diheme cytochrome c family protein